MCLTPRTLRRDIKQPNVTQHTMVVPCGQCPQCLRERQAQWALRLQNEAKRSTTASFLTFTYAKEPVSFNGLPTLDKRDWQLFMKKLRKNTGAKLKYFTVGEYGGMFERPHYHSIMFNLPRTHIINQKYLQEIWNLGHVDIGTVTGASIFYTLGYVMKGQWKPQDDWDDRTPQFAVMSNGLGSNYINHRTQDYHRAGNKIPYCTMPQGWKVNMPRYYKEKIFTEKDNKVIKHYQELQPEIEQFNNEKHKVSWIQNQLRRHEREKLMAKLKLPY